MRITYIVLSLLFLCFVCSQVNCYLLTKERDRLVEENRDTKETNKVLLEKNNHLTKDLTDIQKESDSLKKDLQHSSKIYKDLKDQVKKLEEDKKKLERGNNNLKEDKMHLQNQVKKLSMKDSSGKISRNKVHTSSKKVASATPNKKASKSNTLSVTATAYTAYCTGCSGVTTTGIDLTSHPDMKVIAVDPNVIPLGSRVHVEGYGYAIAGDTGGAIKGNKIDIFVPDRQDALAWGVRTVKVTY
ncbi:hypothetical protein Goe16_00740 [Bacillus phage vB_BsuM-Goe16]|nr:hypothetical protein Goe16_00740 [Bacillus phage vB_BsuM-Goe16]